MSTAAENAADKQVAAVVIEVQQEESKLIQQGLATPGEWSGSILQSWSEISHAKVNKTTPTSKIDAEKDAVKAIEDALQTKTGFQSLEQVRLFFDSQRHNRKPLTDLTWQECDIYNLKIRYINTITQQYLGRSSAKGMMLGDDFAFATWMSSDVILWATLMQEFDLDKVIDILTAVVVVLKQTPLYAPKRSKSVFSMFQ